MKANFDVTDLGIILLNELQDSRMIYKPVHMTYGELLTTVRYGWGPHI